MSSTRGAQAALSRGVKQRLVRALFGQQRRAQGENVPLSVGSQCHTQKEYTMTNHDMRRVLDEASSLSYSRLKEMYLERLHDIHPDKRSESGKGHDDFVELRSAWEEYEALARSSRRVSRGGAVSGGAEDTDATERTVLEEANFTMFGVGCSFADSDRERDLRTDFTDQACRGWIPNTAIPERSTQHLAPSTKFSLCDDDMFTVDDGTLHDENDEETETIISTDAKGFIQSHKCSQPLLDQQQQQKVRRKSLVDDSLPRWRKCK